jgi:hypothetical protein
VDNCIRALTEGENGDGVLDDTERAVVEKFISLLEIEYDEGGRVEYFIQIGPLLERGIDLVQILTVDSENSWMPSHLQVYRNKKLVDDTTWRYRPEAGVTIPEYYRKRISHRDGVHTAFERILELRQSSINTPVSDDMFSYYAIGLRDGDRVKDQIENAVYLVAHGELALPPAALQGASDEPSKVGRAAIWINVAAVALLGILLICKGRKVLRDRATKS